jgi:hypothetical protein
VHTYLHVLMADAESDYRRQRLAREFDGARRRSAEAAAGVAAPGATRRLPRRWLRRLVAAVE